MANAGVLLISGTLESLGYNVDTLQIAKASLPIALAAFALCILQFALCTLYIKRKLNKSDITTNNITGIINVTDTHFISKY